jgi:DNA-binding beta-propeller fold protein YncE
MKTGYIVMAALILAGCAAPMEEARRRYFWPLPPDEPRIEFVASYWSADDFPRTARQKFLEATVGLELPPGFNKPWGIASDSRGKVYIVDTNLKAVWVYDLKSYTVDILGKGEHAGLFWAPVGVALDARGNIYVSDPKLNRVYSFTRDEKPLATIGDDETLNWPVGMAVDDALERLYVVNGRNHNIAVFDLGGKYLFSIGRRGDKDGEFNYPTDVEIDSRGNLVVADSMNARVQILDPEGRFIRKFGQRGDKAEDFQIIKGIAVSRNDDIYVTDGRADKILVFNREGEPLTVIGGTASVAETMKLSPGGFFLPTDIDIDKNDTIFVVDSINRRFQVFQIINEEWLREHPIK